MLKFKNETIEKAFQEGIYADTPANRKLGRVGMSYKEYSKKKKEKDEEEHINKLIEKTETLKKLGGFKLDRVIKYTGFDIDLKKPEAEKRKELAKKYFESASIEELADNSDIAAQADYMDQIIEDALEESVPYNAVPKRDFSKLSSTNLIKELNKEDNWKTGALNINGKTYYKYQDGKFYTIEEPKKGMTKEELFESVDKYLDSLIKTNGVDEGHRKRAGLTKKAYYQKPAVDINKKERAIKAIEEATNYDVLDFSKEKGEMNIIDRTKNDGKEKLYTLGQKTIVDIIADLNGYNGEAKKKKEDKKTWTEKDLSKELKKYPFKAQSGGIVSIDTPFGGGQILKTDNKDNKYEVRTWNDKDEVSEPSHFNSLEECKNHILDTIIKNNIDKEYR